MFKSQQKNVGNLTHQNTFRSVRKKLGKNQAEMAILLRIDRSYLSQIENGRVNPSEKIVENLNALNVEKTNLMEEPIAYRVAEKTPASKMPDIKLHDVSEDDLAEAVLDIGRQLKASNFYLGKLYLADNLIEIANEINRRSGGRSKN